MKNLILELIDRFTGIFTILKGILVAFVLMFLVWLTFPYLTSETEVVKIIKTERINNQKNTDSQYLIYTDKGVYKNVDQWRIWKFNSSDIYGKLEQGKVFKIKSYGFRITFFDIYPNINTIEEVTFVSKAKDKIEDEIYKAVVNKVLN
jgi:hypothetical protein